MVEGPRVQGSNSGRGHWSRFEVAQTGLGGSVEEREGRQ